MKKYFFILIPFLMLFSSCLTGPSGKEKVITAYMESGNMKYYIRPAKMILNDEKDTSSSVMADFTYQMRKRDYVSDAYFNFTLHSKIDSFISKAFFVLDSKETIELFQLETLDRNLSMGYIRVSTILKQEKLKTVLEGLHNGEAVLRVVLDNGAAMEYIPSKDFKNRIQESFYK
ncbi:hypothetical protein E4O05_02005 [Treponema sp. OMZ 787]|nr:hypothetical protein E4O05_02005 [Treponema sp. OMZ 787]